MRSPLRHLLHGIAVAAAFALAPAPALAQCAMCASAGESQESQDGANELGRALYYSILFMLATPFTLAGGLVLFIVKHERAAQAAAGDRS